MNKKLYIAFILFVFILLSSDIPIADAADAVGKLNKINQQFLMTASAWKNIVIGYATKLFWILAPISFVLTTGDAWLKGQISDATSFLAHFISTCIFLGFFLWLLQNGPNFAKTIIDSMAEIGKQASGLDSNAPSDMMKNVFTLFYKISKIPVNGLESLGNYLGAMLIGIPILIIVALIAVNLTIEYCAAWIVLYAGAFVLGFGSTRWTSDMAIAYFKTVLGTALRLMTMIFLIGIISNILTAKISQQNNININDLAELLIYAIIFLSLMNTVPNMIAGMVGGGQGVGNLNAGSVVAAATAAGAAAGMVGATMGIASAGISTAAGMATSSANIAGAGMVGAAGLAGSAIDALGSAFSGSSSSDSGPVFNSNPTQFATPVSDSASSSSGSSTRGKGAGDYLARAARDFGNDLEK